MSEYELIEPSDVDLAACPESVRDYIEALESMHDELNGIKWQPIETAPRDASAILVMRDNWPGAKTGRAEECNGHNTYVAQWWADDTSGGHWVCYMDMVQDPDCPIEPTHWRPLPAPPIFQSQRLGSDDTKRAEFLAKMREGDVLATKDAEARYIDDGENACPACGGSGHKDDAADVVSQAVKGENEACALAIVEPISAYIYDVLYKGDHPVTSHTHQKTYEVAQAAIRGRHELANGEAV